MVCSIRRRLALVDPRARAGVALLLLVYSLGWSLGRASGKIDVLERYAGPAQ